MGWTHPEISLEELMNLVKGFIDIVILASGYQSSGLHAHWDAENIKKALQWGLFFENVLKKIPDSGDYTESMKELDLALSELTSNPFFPQALMHLSSSALLRARELVLRHLLHTLPLRDEQLTALLIATVEMDLEDIKTKTEGDPLNAFIDLLMVSKSSKIPNKESQNPFLSHGVSSDCQAMEDSKGRNAGILNISGLTPELPSDVFSTDANGKPSADNCKIVIEEVLKKHAAVSCVSSIEVALGLLSESVKKKTVIYDASSIWVSDGSDRIKEGTLTGSVRNQWKSSGLAYLLDKRTLNLVSGSSMIFCAPKVQWSKVLDSLKGFSEAYDENLKNILELSLLGLVADKWSSLIEQSMSLPLDGISISKMYFEVLNLHACGDKYQSSTSKVKTANSKENDVRDYLSLFLNSWPCLLWRIPPILPAAAIPLWSELFNLYVGEIERQINKDSPSIRRCDCHPVGKEHTTCEIAERIWYLYIFHINLRDWVKIR
ncbi:uncharacterized protein LOC18447335 isoform X1 [Amborella trichopoda]|uniref:uncharacterized protein LOC18447335 isoform X1 n=2 Tax=Amborella trichopoda TaxID=13333 RepID=UPI0009BD3073|nr:uncharacterized protein LOC18447335 isoform X1 [Amborella trichopoda]|eukprot:XP_020531085.1 uncharacterized protein LOC18447335 isoform X1 [Amborella trichopoda]